MDPPDRWILPGLDAALGWTRERNGQGIRCTLALAGEYARSPGDAENGAEGNITCLRAIARERLDASLSVKPSGLGGLADRDGCRGHLARIARESAALGVALEIDMEGKGYVDLTLGLAESARAEHPRVTVALQSYLDRTGADIRRMVAAGIRIRLVKGAYLGDARDFGVIQRLTREDARLLRDLGAPFSLGTHDPVLLAAVQEEMRDARDLVEFGFLQGLSDLTKLSLAREGWQVSEYVPCGPGGDGYIHRRQRYLEDLARAGLAPAP